MIHTRVHTLCGVCVQQDGGVLGLSQVVSHRPLSSGSELVMSPLPARWASRTRWAIWSGDALWTSSDYLDGGDLRGDVDDLY